MKKLLILLFCLPFMVKAQVNLVPNPSFEDTSNIVNLNSLPLNMQDCLHWYNPTEATPDYFNEFLYPLIVNSNIQHARTGKAQTHLSYSNNPAFLNGGDSYNEYTQVRLSSPLVSGKIYHVGYYYRFPGFTTGKVVKNMGFRFSNDTLSHSNTSFLGNNPPYSYSLDSNLFQLPPDTISWMKLEHYYTAQGGEEFLTIGNLNNGDSTGLMNINIPISINPVNVWASYVVDDVFVLDIEQLQDTDLVYVDTFNMGVPVTYNCIENTCIDPLDATGTYSTLADCQAVCGVNAIKEEETNKLLIKITDVFGRESKPQPNTPLFYRYSDGTVEKKIIVE